jgi:hypothetical protein
MPPLQCSPAVAFVGSQFTRSGASPLPAMSVLCPSETFKLPRSGQSAVKKQTFKTERRHVIRTGIVLIGKEANRVGESGEADPIFGAVAVLR